jgi:hypothetical protein
MGELPRTDELPRSENGYDAARVEEAFASFAERVHELESVAGELRAELNALRSERREQRRGGFERSGDTFEHEEWPAGSGQSAGGVAPSPDWVSSVPAPLTRPVAVPRLALEASFLVLVAVFAGLADLSTTAIVLLMAAAWALVVLSEWAAAAKRARWRLESIAPPVAAGGDGTSDSTGPWSIPVVEATVVEAPDGSESHTVVTKLPPPAEAEPEADRSSLDDTGEIEAKAEAPVADAEPEPKRRRFLRRRRKEDDEPSSEVADPWEA